VVNENMRVIGGKAKGRRLKVPKGRTLRPTAARVKEALFNILPHDLSGLETLDLFAGTGNMTLEALSRGAAAATLVEVSTEGSRVIRENVKRLGVADRCRLLSMPVARALRHLDRQREIFDLIFIDPPYGQQWVERTLAIIAQSSLLRAPGVIVAEHSVRDPVGDRYGDLVLCDRRRYGDTVLSFFRRQRAEKSQVRNLANGTR
jgi:16S rRNA (guanine(966)-N(2))-methyltransferase RsmD